MTPEEARELLEVDAAVTGDALRRAYLRRIKQHTPERDLEGFRALREAYEVLTARRELADPTPDAQQIAEQPATKAARAKASALLAEGAPAAAIELAHQTLSDGADAAAGWLDVVLELYERGHLAEAHVLLVDVRRSLADRGDALRLSRDERLRLALTSQLPAVADRLAPELTRAIARALRSFPIALEEVRAYRAKRPFEAHGAADILFHAAPSLGSQFAASLRGPRRAPYASVSTYVTVGLLSLIVFRVVPGLVTSEAPPPTESAHRSTEVRTRDTSEVETCTWDGAACLALTRMSVALDRERCDDAERSAQRFARTYARLGRDEPRLLEMRAALEERFAAHCGPSADVDDPGGAVRR